MIIHHAAAGISSVVGLQGRASTKARQTVSQLFEIVRAHDFVVAGVIRVPSIIMRVTRGEIRTPGHDPAIVAHSPFVRLQRRALQVGLDLTSLYIRLE